MPPGFQKEMGFSFHWDIKEVADAYDIPDNLVINIDQTPLPFILLSKYEMDKKNEKLAPIAYSAIVKLQKPSQLPFLLFLYPCK